MVLKLTVYENGDTCCVNWDNVLSAMRLTDKEATCPKDVAGSKLHFVGSIQRFVYVSETPEEIYDMLKGD